MGKHISGPINAIRLEGTINNKAKVLYAFMDFHEDIQNQTECDDVRSNDIKTYLVQNFDKITNNNKTYDFFLEIYPTELLHLSAYKGTYLQDTITMFGKAINIENNQVKKSKTFPNIRFHYLDIRTYLFNFSIFDTNHIIDSLSKLSFNYYDLVRIKDLLLIEYNYAKISYNSLYSEQKKTKSMPTIPESVEILNKYTPADIEAKAKQLYYKIANQYNNQEIKKVIQKIINLNVKDFFHKYFEANNRLIDYLEMVIKKWIWYFEKKNGEHNIIPYGMSVYDIIDIIKNVQSMAELRFYYFLNVYTLITDLYFLRRFLDKDYIENVVVYTGGKHTENYIYVLLKYFNFKVTHASYMESDLNKKIKDDDKQFGIINEIYPPKLLQCSDVSSFPDLFQ